ncbi:HTH-type transcriptional regulator MalT [soil metagenome]
MGSTATAGVRQRRRVIQRPRLLALLDESKTRVRTLVAAAGYGKTMLAEQWIHAEGRRGGWYAARRSSTDVAALALGLARASTGLVPNCDERLREHLRALSGSTAKVDVLGDILAEDLAAWPSDGWLVIDDYQEIAAAEDAERFVGALASASPVQLLIASRQRPCWVTARRILYDEVLELNQTTLAMDAHEASQVLAGRSAPSASGLVAVANGWPAVIGLAGVSNAELEDSEQLPESLYLFFAEEVFASLDDEVKAGLATLAVAPVLDRELATTLLGAERAEIVCSSALEVGILVERGGLVELHPLARSFLEERCPQLGFVPEPDSVAKSVEHYIARREWDAAFDVISRNRLVKELELLVLEALDELLDTARLQTIEAWCEVGASLGMKAPTLSLARSEVALRHGHLSEAQVHAEAAANDESELRFRALCLAGRAAHIASREQEALELYRRAEMFAPTPAARRDTLWGQLICATELELPEAGERMRTLVAGVSRSDTREILQSATYGIGYGSKFGLIDLAAADAAYELLRSVDDPLVVASFQSVYSSLLGLAARYDDALRVSEEFLVTVRQYRLDFAIPYALTSTAVALAGCRDWQRASDCANEALARSCRARDVAGQQHSFTAYMRVLAQHRNHRKALTIEIPSLRSATPAIRAEVLLSRALVLASVGRVDEAQASADEVSGSTRAVEPTVLAASVAAVAAVKRGGADAVERVVDLEDVAFETGAVDILVTAYRSVPELLPLLLRTSRNVERLGLLLNRARDEDLAVAAGHDVRDDSDPKTRLSPREREVYDLLGQGLTNLQIAQLLFISEGTVKVHVHHIYDKLGIRSRTAIAVQAALERSDQATSAIDDVDSVDGS